MPVMLSCPQCGEPVAKDAWGCAACKADLHVTPPIQSHTPGARTSTLCGILVVVSFLVAAVSLFMVSQATLGVWLMAGACLLGIWARIVQAADYHRGR